MNRLCLLPLLAALTLPLAACGNKGDLFLPPPPQTVVDDETGRPVEATDEADDDADATPQDEAADDARDAADEPAQALPLPPPPLPVEEDDGAGDDGA
ncbi:LPS translocon maturation chaperone LptM [Luteimonas huabeiensis]|uniref:LPS translocon maturation chaperone LptM n=1 Tax=Luteimonas huabeiensis TaxID=1244513 RepID=UPI0004B4AC77|nr:lipoprotein [Luteimonas huabeiensis]